MDEAQLDDLKQFIDARISRSEANTTQKLEVLRRELITEMRSGFDGVADALEAMNKHFDERISRLEAALV